MNPGCSNRSAYKYREKPQGYCHAIIADCEAPKYRRSERVPVSLSSVVYIIASLTLLVAATANPASAFAYDANVDFAPNSPNPNDVWSYGYTTSLGGAFTPHLEHFSTLDAYGWRTNLGFGAPAFTYFTSPGFGILAGETSLHGGPNNEFSVVRFTTPATGPYDLLATWRGPGDTGNTDYICSKTATVDRYSVQQRRPRSPE